MNKEDQIYLEKTVNKPLLTKSKKKHDHETHRVCAVAQEPFPKEPDTDWKEYMIEGEKRMVHNSSKEMLDVYYFLCPHENVFYHKYNNQIYMDEKGFRIGQKEAESRVHCVSTGAFLPKSMGVEIPDPNDHPNGKMLISKADLKAGYWKCDFSQKMYPAATIIQVKGHPKYKQIFHLYITEDNGLRRCCKCLKVGELDKVKPRPDLPKTAHFYCDDCYKAIVNKGIINPYNWTQYPAAKKVSLVRRGAEKIMGSWVATNNPEPVENPRHYGVELEIELSLNACVKAKVDRFDLAREITQALGKDFIMIKEDGSLLMNGHYGNNAKDPQFNKPTGPKYAGFEVVSGPCNLAVHYERWPQLERIDHFNVLRAWDTETCAMHVHVSRDALTNLQIGKIIRSINVEFNRKFVQKVAGRSSRKYANYANQKISDCLHANRVVSAKEQGAHDKSRRVPINISRSDTVEFRIFRGTVNARHILRNLEFCDAMCDFCKPCNSSLSEIDDYNNFLSFVSKNRKKWPILAEWLALWKYIQSPTLKDFVNPHALTILPERVAEGEDKLDGAYAIPLPEELSAEAKKLVKQL